jgi:hypothetical protein
MAQERKFLMALGVAALTFGITNGLTPAPREIPLGNSDILIVDNETALPSVDTNPNAEESAKMGKESGTQVGQKQDQDQGNTDQTQSQKMSGGAAPTPPAPEDNDISKE